MGLAASGIFTIRKMVSLKLRPSTNQEAYQEIRNALTMRFYSTANLGSQLHADFKPYLRQEGHKYLANNFLLSLQPFTAWVGLVGVVLIFIIVSAMWWDTPATLAKVLAAYGAVSPPRCPPLTIRLLRAAKHIAVFLFILIIKCYRGTLQTWFTEHPCDVNSLEQVLSELDFLSKKSESRSVIDVVT